MIEWLWILAVFPAALLFEGLYRKLVARMQNRIGPPVLQPFYDLRKMFSKKPFPRENDIFFNSAPMLYFLSHFLLFLFVPFALLSFSYDFILLIYLTLLASAFTILAGLSSDSPYSTIGSMREMLLMISYEAAFAVVVITAIMASGTLSLSGLTGFGFARLPIAAFCLLWISLVKLRIPPLDTASASSEIMAGVEMEYPEQRLLFMELTAYSDKLFYALLWPMLFIGTANPALFVAGVLGMLLWFAISKAVNARWRADQASNFMFFILILALIEFIRISWGLLWTF